MLLHMKGPSERIHLRQLISDRAEVKEKVEVSDLCHKRTRQSRDTPPRLGPRFLGSTDLDH